MRHTLIFMQSRLWCIRVVYGRAVSGECADEVERGERKHQGVCSRLCAERLSVFRLTSPVMSLLSAVLVYVCVCVHAWGMLMPRLVIPCEPSRQYLLCNWQSSECELCLQSRNDRQRGREMDGWIKSKEDTFLLVCAVRFTWYATICISKICLGRNIMLPGFCFFQPIKQNPCLRHLSIRYSFNIYICVCG